MFSFYTVILGQGKGDAIGDVNMNSALDKESGETCTVRNAAIKTAVAISHRLVAIILRSPVLWIS